MARRQVRSDTARRGRTRSRPSHPAGGSAVPRGVPGSTAFRPTRPTATDPPASTRDDGASATRTQRRPTARPPACVRAHAAGDRPAATNPRTGDQPTQAVPGYRQSRRHARLRLPWHRDGGPPSSSGFGPDDPGRRSETALGPPMSPTRHRTFVPVEEFGAVPRVHSDRNAGFFTRPCPTLLSGAVAGAPTRR